MYIAEENTQVWITNLLYEENLGWIVEDSNFLYIDLKIEFQPSLYMRSAEATCNGPIYNNEHGTPSQLSDGEKDIFTHLGGGIKKARGKLK